MRKYALLILPLLGLFALQAPAQPEKVKPRYHLEYDQKRDLEKLDSHEGKQAIFFKVRFAVNQEGGATVDKLDGDYRVVIKEDGKQVKVFDVLPPLVTVVSEDITVAMALDTSGSMTKGGRMEQARLAAEVFLKKLPGKSECGLILFDHETRKTIDLQDCVIQPILDREPLRKMIYETNPRGGTAYLDAAVNGIRMVRGVRTGRERAVVLITDGLDINSTKKVDDVIKEAKKGGKIDVRVYTIGIGEPGKFEQVNTVLVLDHSGSMQPPANDQDKVSKIEALHLAAVRYVDSMSLKARVSIVPFSTQVGKPQEFRLKYDEDLKPSILKLKPKGETAVFDATYDAIGVLEADNSKGKRAVVAMTDGWDNSSRRRVEEVIERAKEANIPLYLLGFGREAEIDMVTMQRMATETNGKFYHAKSKDDLINIFENLSIELHDDGIDEETLKRIANETGGQYFPAKNVNDLKLVLEQVGKTIQREKQEFNHTFESLNQRADGKERIVTIELIRTLDGVTQTLQKEESSSFQRGLVIAEMNHLFYFVLLLAIGGLIALPGLLRRTATV